VFCFFRLSHLREKSNKKKENFSFKMIRFASRTQTGRWAMN